MDLRERKRIVLHNDFTNFLINTPGAEEPANAAEAARLEVCAGTNIISPCAGVGPEMR
jgi:hypothetical protein